MTITTATYITAPTTTPLRGTLLDAATVSSTGFAWTDGTGLFESYNCMKFQSQAEFCAPNTKDFDQSGGWQDGFRFAAYGGVTCRSVGLDKANQLAQVERVFRAGESTAVEQALMMQAGFASVSGSPTDFTPAGGAVDPKVGIAILESLAASEYVGIPTLHVPRSIASLAMSYGGMEYRGDTLYTALGSKVAAGAGYDYPNYGPTGTEAAAGEKWLYATGEVVISPGPVEVRQVIAQENNDVLVLAERGYVVVIDCFTAAIRVTVTG